jgi:hypothetical protein
MESPLQPHPASDLTSGIDDDYLLPEARELVKRLRPDSKLSEDEILVLALAAAQAALRSMLNRATPMRKPRSTPSSASWITGRWCRLNCDACTR